MTGLETLIMGINMSFFISMLIGYMFLRLSEQAVRFGRLALYSLLIATAGLLAAIVVEFSLAGTLVHYIPDWLLNLDIYCTFGEAGLLIGMSLNKG